MVSDTTYQGHQESLLRRQRGLLQAKKNSSDTSEELLNMFERYCQAGI